MINITDEIKKIAKGCGRSYSGGINYNGEKIRIICGKDGLCSICGAKLQTLLECQIWFKELINKTENPYPKDIFEWDNSLKVDITKGRFNKFCFEIWENCKKEILKEIKGEN